VKIRLIDNLPPEDLAMLQALYSRSAQSVSVHLDRVAAGGSSRFMKDYVAGYNHKSIADCGTTSIFIEGVSLLAAKAVQDWPLYSGQETSTRYIDMSQQPIVDPIGTPASKAILDRWMAFYGENFDRVAGHVEKTHPRRDGEDEKRYLGAVGARRFDILRGFLPAGITTQLSWHTNLRQAGDHVAGLVHHPSPEIRALGLELRAALAKAYPDSGFGQSLPSVSGVAASPEALADRTAWEAKVAAVSTYFNVLEDWSDRDIWRTVNVLDVDMEDVRVQRLRADERDLLRTRPRGCALPHFMARVGLVRLDGWLDFGSFRDLQRHRNGVCQMPLLTTRFEFEPWYLEQLPEYVREGALKLIEEQTRSIAAIDAPDVHKQYLTPLGFNVPIRCSYPFPAFVYLIEMRSAKTVHPTLRKLVRRAINVFRRSGITRDTPIALHVDEDPDDWTVRRGAQTITRREP
jgi:thymidylate synthase ThyX